MKRIFRREVLIETEQITFFVNRSKKENFLCIFCEAESLMLPPCVIAETLKMSSREIYRLIETENVHFVENDAKQLYVCIATLSAEITRREKLVH